MALDFRDAFYRFFYLVIGVIDAGLILASAIITLTVLHRRINDIEVREKQGIKAYFLRIIRNPHRFTKSGVSCADTAIIRVRLAGAVRVSAFRVDDARNGLHQRFQSPKASARQIYNVFRCVLIHFFSLLRDSVLPCRFHLSAVAAFLARFVLG